MAIIHSRRRFVTNAAVAGAAGFGALGAISRGGGGKSFAAEPPPEISTIRLEKLPVACLAPQYLAEELLHAEGFTDVRYIASDTDVVVSKGSTRRGGLDDGFRAGGDLGVGWRRTADNGRRRARRVLRAVRARSHSQHSRPEGQDGWCAPGLRNAEASGEHHGELRRRQPK